MNQDDLQLQAKKLKDLIISGVNEFKYETGMVPGVEIKVIQTFNGCHEVTSTVEVTINVNL